MIPVLLLSLFTTQETPRQVWADFDHDGLLDLYSIAEGRPDVLLRNLGDGSFADVTEESGLDGNRSRAVQPGDFDQDGQDDLLLISNAGELVLYRGLEAGAFVRETEAGLGGQNIEQAEWIDYDQDGWADLKAETALGQPVFFHNLEGLSFERIDLGLESAAVNVTVALPSVEPEKPEQAPSLGGRILVGGPGSGSGMRSLRTPPDGSRAPLSTGGDVETSLIDLVCAEAVRDASNRDDCIQASTNPTLGMLYPLSTNWYIDSATGNVGIGTTTPAEKLTVDGPDARIELLHAGNPVASLGATDFFGEAALNLDLSPSGYSSFLTSSTLGFRDSSGTVTAQLGGGAGILLLRDVGTGLTTVGLQPGYLQGGRITLGTSYGELTADLSGDDEDRRSSRLRLFNRTGANSFAGVDLRANDGFGAEFELFNNDGIPIFDFDANTSSPRMTMRQGDGSFGVEFRDGNALQANSASGFVKAGCHVDGSAASVTSWFENFRTSSTPVTVTRAGTGRFDVDFGVDVSGRFFDATLDGRTTPAVIRVNPSLTSNTVVNVSLFNLSGSLADGDFWLTVY